MFPDNISIKNVKMDRLKKMFNPSELRMMLSIEPNSSEMDKLLLKLKDYFEEMEEYEYCAQIRDEILDRKIKIDK